MTGWIPGEIITGNHLRPNDFCMYPSGGRVARCLSRGSRQRLAFLGDGDIVGYFALGPNGPTLAPWGKP